MRAVNIEDLRKEARRRLPRAIFDFVDGGSDDEWTRRRNRAAFQRYTFRPRMLVDVSHRDQSTTLFGHRIETPVIISPTGMPGICWPRAEVLAARAAGTVETIFSLSTFGTCSIEQVAEAASGPLWLQLYVAKDRGFALSLIERAQAAGYQALALTVDTQVASQRERDVRNGFTSPPRITARNVLDSARRVGWLRRFLTGPRLSFGNLDGQAATASTGLWEQAKYVSRELDPSVTWADLDQFRALWKGSLLLKGIMSAEDARRALDHGVDGIVVSNHGGRQLDSLPASIEVLPEIVDAVDGRAEVLLDSGIRRGSDVVKAVALGARAVMVGRPYLWGLACGGQAGVEQALGILKAEIDRTLALLGCPRLVDLDRSYLRTCPLPSYD